MRAILTGNRGPWQVKNHMSEAAFRLSDAPVERPVNRVPTWVLVAGIGSVLLVLVVFIVFKLMLSAEVSAAASRMLL